MAKGRKAPGSGAPSRGGKLDKEVLRAILNENEELRRRIIDLETAKAGGVVALVDGGSGAGSGAEAADQDDIPRVEYAGDEPDLGPVYLAKVYCAKCRPGDRMTIPVAIGGTDRRGKKFLWKRRIITEREIPLPEDIIKRLETPQEDEYQVSPESLVYEAYLRGDLEAAQKECKSMGFDRVVVRSTGLKYVREVRNYTIVRGDVFTGGIIRPSIVGVRV